MFDENTPIPYGPLKGKKISEITDPMELRSWLAIAPTLIHGKPTMTMDGMLAILNSIGKHVDGDSWVPYKLKPEDESYVAPFGKFKGMKLSKIPRNELDSYMKFLEKQYTLTAVAKEYLAKGRAYLAVNLN